ncbi:hypothetical protein Rumeso_03002 [Rubellimicrobium mesophilum DSM 19309]|uniref:Uncharacterized protein n=1 Tax=Rubellimicrobium mesophilum DSM 19309 TaxID=442562 RepID=A0A017HLQ8_9RHOB|nr:hypothetical protein Rumeso_03002 [Rubellimicrobium mesophilum DSM 19309]
MGIPARQRLHGQVLHRSSLPLAAPLLRGRPEFVYRSTWIVLQFACPCN